MYNLDGDGRLEIILVCDDANLYVLKSDGSMLAGWPQPVDVMETPGLTMHSTPAVGDVDGDGDPEIVAFGWPYSSPARLTVFHHNGQVLNRWPIQTGNGNISPALADLDEDGALEIIASSGDNSIHVWRGNGRELSGWPRTMDESFGCPSSPAVGDLDGEPGLEVVVGGCRYTTDNPLARVWAWHNDGEPVHGFPVYLPVNQRPTSPIIADVDGDRSMDVLVGTYTNQIAESTDQFGLFAWNYRGRTLSGFPLLLGNEQIISTPVVTDIDNDGLIEIMATSFFESKPNHWISNLYARHFPVDYKKS